MPKITQLPEGQSAAWALALAPVPLSLGPAQRALWAARWPPTSSASCGDELWAGVGGAEPTCLKVKGAGAPTQGERWGGGRRSGSPADVGTLSRPCREMKLIPFIIDSVGRDQGFLELKPIASWA